MKKINKDRMYDLKKELEKQKIKRLWLYGANRDNILIFLSLNDEKEFCKQTDIKEIEKINIFKLCGFFDIETSLFLNELFSIIYTDKDINSFWFENSFIDKDAESIKTIVDTYESRYNISYMPITMEVKFNTCALTDDIYNDANCLIKVLENSDSKIAYFHIERIFGKLSININIDSGEEILYDLSLFELFNDTDVKNLLGKDLLTSIEPILFHMNNVKTFTGFRFNNGKTTFEAECTGIAPKSIISTNYLF